MDSNNSNGSRAAWSRGFMTFFAAMLAMGLGLMASPAEASPFAYITNFNSNTVSVIDTATNKVVATVAVGNSPTGVAVTPDGKHVYVTNQEGVSVSVIATATNKVVATVEIHEDSLPTGIAVTPDGKLAYFTLLSFGIVEMIATATNKEVGLGILVGNGSGPTRVAVSPAGNTSMSRIMAPAVLR